MVETERLQIIPLKPAKLECYLRAGGEFEKLFNLRDTGRTVSEDVRERVKQIILPKLRKMKGKDYLFSTFWIVVEKNSSAIVAELGFKGVPDKDGVIEIGYGTMPSQRGKGIMTEAVGGMVQWAKTREEIDFIYGETNMNNLASIRVLEKNKFESFDLQQNMKWWRIKTSEL